MQLTPKVKEILSWYEGESPGVKGSLARFLMHGRLAGTGHLVILPVDQGYEHGPARSFASNPPAYDPHYLYQLAIDAGLNAMPHRSACWKRVLMPMPASCRPSSR
jgi:fructose-bisphosphate aldolase, class I